MVQYIGSDIAGIIRCVSEILFYRKQEVTSEHSFDNIVRRTDHVIILVAKLDFGEHGLVDIEGLIDDFNFLACLFKIPLLKLSEQFFIDVVSPVIYFENAASVFRTAEQHHCSCEKYE